MVSAVFQKKRACIKDLLKHKDLQTTIIHNANIIVISTWQKQLIQQRFSCFLT